MQRPFSDVLRALLLRGPLDCAALHAAVGWPYEAIQIELARLTREGRVVACDADRYRWLTPRERYERLVTLHDGRVVGSWSEELREECEARFVLNLPNKMARRAALWRIEHGDPAKGRKGRGRDAAAKLESDLISIHRAQTRGVDSYARNA